MRLGAKFLWYGLFHLFCLGQGNKYPLIGGFSLSNNRSQFPLSGGIVSITSEHPKADGEWHPCILLAMATDQCPGRR
jgi:hypothetical protein